jgi:hypothetical protein
MHKAGGTTLAIPAAVRMKIPWANLLEGFENKNHM